MSTSTDRGLTWSTPIPTAGHDKGLGGQSVALSNGTAVVPFFSLNGKIEAFTSTNRGASWTKGVEISSARSHAIAVNWSATARIPIDSVTSTVDHFLPGLALDPATSGSSAHLAVTYYFYPNVACGGACRL